MIMGKNFKGIQHIGVPVTDLKRSKEFYVRLGFKDVMSSTFAINGGKGVVAMMKRGGAVLELYQMPAKELEEIRTRKDGHIDHITFGVVDIEKVFDELKRAGFQIIEDKPVFLNFWEKGCKYFVVLGPDGERLEFNQIL
jgi:catechol 2,3-dioxygenase-like lactoylglutathione lyase family enzyme